MFLIYFFVFSQNDKNDSDEACRVIEEDRLKQVSCITGICNYMQYYTTDASSEAGTKYPPEAPEFTPGFSGIRVTLSLVLFAMFQRLLFVLLFFFIWSLCCLSFFDLQILITPLLSSNSSYQHDTMDASSEAGTSYPSGAPVFIPSFQWGLCCLISSFLCSVLVINVCLFVRLPLVIVLSVRLLFRAYGYPFGIYCMIKIAYKITDNVLGQ